MCVCVSLSFLSNLVSVKVITRLERCSLHIGTPRSRDTDSTGTSLLVFFDDKLDSLSVGQTTESLGLNGRLMDENIIGTVVGVDKAKALDSVEPGVSSLE